MKSAKRSYSFKTRFAATVCLFLGAACSKSANSDSDPTPSVLPAAHLTPGSVSLAGASVAKGSTTVTTHALYAANVSLIGFSEAWGSREVDVDLGSYDQTADFGGENASLSITAQAQDYPNALLDSSGAGGAYAVLTSFYVQPAGGGASVEYVNTTAQCRSEGMWQCSSGYCDPHPACTVATGASGFATRTDWDQHQVPPNGYATTNSFPRCDSTIAGWSNCPAGFGRLVSGHYHAKYILLSDSGNAINGRTANLKVSLRIKKDTQARGALATNGGFNVNVVLVGDKNVNDSHTQAGARNLNLLFAEVNRLFATASGAKLGINQIKVYEWTDANGGSQYSQVDYTALGDLFESGSKGVDAVDEGHNINIFIVSDIGYTGANFTILGLSGAILGPAINGTAGSGLAFSSFNKLATYNPACTSGSCDRTLLQTDFLEMAATIVHELGHYLGLNHPSEKPDTSGTQTHDGLNDTPTCAARTSGSSRILDQRACYQTDTTTQSAPLSGTCASACNTSTGGAGASLSDSYLTTTPATALIDPWTSYSNTDMPGVFCPAVQACQHNHIMWYTTKNRRLQKSDGSTCTSADITGGTTCTWNEDGNLFSPESAAILQWDPFVQ